jgi:hypothetical protein
MNMFPIRTQTLMMLLFVTSFLLPSCNKVAQEDLRESTVAGDYLCSDTLYYFKSVRWDSLNNRWFDSTWHHNLVQVVRVDFDRAQDNLTHFLEYTYHLTDHYTCDILDDPMGMGGDYAYHLSFSGDSIRYTHFYIDYATGHTEHRVLLGKRIR